MIDRVKEWLAALDDWSRRNRWPRITRRAVTGFLDHEALQYAGSMAYFAVLSIFQLLVLGVVIGSYVLGEGEARSFVVEQVDAGSPLDAETVGGIIDAVIESRGAMSIITIAFLVWSALGVFSALSNGIGRVFENTPKRPFLKDKLIGLLLMGLTGALAVASLVIGIVTGILQAVAADLIADLPGGGTAIWLIGLLAPLLLIFLAFWVIYRVVPNRPVGWGEVLPGAIVAAVLWTILRFGFTWYATSVANYESAFGPISTGITLLVFLYFASVIVLLGAEFARASALDDEVGEIAAADPRLLPVLVDVPPGPAPAARRGGVPKPVWIGLAAVAGAIIGRLTKRDTDEEI
ncbi:MAG TPA: YihY/virulence factor BrkB family protein [Candidatus Angelobacter sp.]|nr:YihY/virulence factor BrkB family protein [Candidatus Angelobacter sp.]